MQRYNGQLLNQFPNTVTGISAAGAQITVRVKSTGALATLYATNSTSGAALSNPLTADSKGYYGFYAPDGVYTLDVSLSGTPQLEIQLQDVASLQSQFNDAVSNAGYIPVGTFAAGCTVSQANGVVSDGVSYWRWDGALPKTVTAGSSPVPTGVGGWFLVGGSAQKGFEPFNVKNYGAKGDGATDDTAAVQLAINAAVAAGGGTVFFPTGTYIVLSVNLRWGITLEGAGNSVIKRPANSGNWVRTLTTENNLWDSTVDSPPLVIKNLILDGNRDNQGAYTSYQLEQSHLLFLVAQTTKSGRLRCFVDSCSFINCVADGVSQFTNTDLNINNCYMSNCFRGGLVVTGGFSRLRASNIIIKGEVNSRGIDFEIDGGGFGGSFDTFAELSNIDVNSHFDLSVKGNSRVVANNINFGDISNYRAFFVAADGNSSIQINNSSFLIAGGAGALNQIRFANNVAFSNTNFVLTNFGTATGQNIGIEVYANTKRFVRMTNCSFEVMAGSNLSDNFVPLLHTAGNSTSHRTLLSGCSFGAGIDIAISLPQGGFCKAENCYFDAATALSFGGFGIYPCDAQLVDCEYGASNAQLWYSDGNDAAMSLYVSGQISAAKYNFSGIGGENWNYRSDLTVFGSALNPNTGSVKGMPNDTYKTTTFAKYTSGATVMYVGSSLTNSPFFTWVPVNRS